MFPVDDRGVQAGRRPAAERARERATSRILPAPRAQLATRINPVGTSRQVAGDTIGASVDLGIQVLPGIPVYQAYANVTGLVARDGGGAWSADGWPGGGSVDGLGWTLVVVTADSVAPSGQVIGAGARGEVDRTRAASLGFHRAAGREDGGELRRSG